MPNEYELKPQFENCGSYYGKARVRVDDDGNKFLISYATVVCWVDAATGNMHRLWDGWSATTGRHIKEFALQCGLKGKLGKQAWDSLEVEQLPHPVL